MNNRLAQVATPFAGGIKLAVKAKPGAKRRREARIVDIGEGKRAVEISVAALARDGEANVAILEQIAEALQMKMDNLSIKSGAAGRLKHIEILGNPSDIQNRIEKWLSLNRELFDGPGHA
ncbi:MAG: DUF167 domain-containing protein [Bdellovibrionales bacterium]